MKIIIKTKITKKEWIKITFKNNRKHKIIIRFN